MVIFSLCLPFDAYGYIGPGSGLTVIGSVLAFIGVILLYAISFFWYPIKRLLISGKSCSRESINRDLEPEEADQPSDLP